MTTRQVSKLDYEGGSCGNCTTKDGITFFGTA